MSKYSLYNNFEEKISEKYSILTMVKYGQDNKSHNLSLYLKRLDYKGERIEFLDLITDEVFIECNPKNVYIRNKQVISEANKKELFQKYIDRFEYQLECFNTGDSLSTINKL